MLFKFWYWLIKKSIKFRQNYLRNNCVSWLSLHRLNLVWKFQERLLRCRPLFCEIFRTIGVVEVCFWVLISAWGSDFDCFAVLKISAFPEEVATESCLLLDRSVWKFQERLLWYRPLFCEIFRTIGPVEVDFWLSTIAWAHEVCVYQTSKYLHYLNLNP